MPGIRYLPGPGGEIVEVDVDDQGKVVRNEDGEVVTRPAADPLNGAAVLVRRYLAGELEAVTVTPGEGGVSIVASADSLRDTVGRTVIDGAYQLVYDQYGTGEEARRVLAAIYTDNDEIIQMVIAYVDYSAAEWIYGHERVAKYELAKDPTQPVPNPPQGIAMSSAATGQGPLPRPDAAALSDGAGGQGTGAGGGIVAGAGGTQPGGAPTGAPDSDHQGTNSTPTDGGKTGGDPVVLASGCFVHRVTDLALPGLGIHFAFQRTYLHQVRFRGPIGFNWDHSYNLWLREAAESMPDGRRENVVYRSTGECREDRYVQRIGLVEGDLPPLADAVDAAFDGPRGFFDRLEKSGARYVLETPAGVRIEYGEHLYAERIVDRNGNAVALRYDGLQLVEVEDPSGRRVGFTYDALGQLRRLDDHTSGRSVRFDYSSNGDLEEVDLVFGDGFVLGTDYRYLGPDVPDPLQHNLVEIIAAAGESVLENRYGLDTGDPGFNRVVEQRSEAGEYRYEYASIVEMDVDPSLEAHNVPVRATAVRNAHGHVIEHRFNSQGNAVERRETVVTDAGLVPLASRYRYDPDGLLVEEVRPDGAAVAYEYQGDVWRRDHADDPAAVPAPAERLAFANLLRVVQRPRPGTGETRRIVTEFEYGPGNRQTSQRGPFYAGLDLRPLPGQRFPTATLHYDERGNLVEVAPGERTLADGSRVASAPTIVTFDARGRMTEGRTAGRRTAVRYFEDLLRSGQVRERIDDAGGVAHVTTYDVDGQGRVTGVSSHLGARMETTWTSFDRPEATRLDAVGGGERPMLAYSYDRQRRVVAVAEVVVDATGRAHPDGRAAGTYRYDRYGRLVEWRTGVEGQPPEDCGTLTWSAAGLLERSTDGRGVVTRTAYDQRMLPATVTEAVGVPEERIRRFGYDASGRVVAVVDGRGVVTRVEWDGFGRRAAVRHPDGEIERFEYDAAGRPTRRLLEGRGPASGATIRWAETDAVYDEVGRLVEQVEHLFVPGASAPPEQDELLRRRWLHDDFGRVVRHVSPTGAEWRYEHDGADRLLRATDPDGNVVAVAYDDAARTVTTTVTAVRSTGSAGGGQAAVQRTSALVHLDAFGREIERRTATGDVSTTTRDGRGRAAVLESPGGQRVAYTFDLLGRLMAATSGNGPDAVTVRYDHDATGRREVMVTPIGGIVVTNRDVFGRVTSVERGDSRTTFQYDADGNPVEVRDEQGVLISSTFTAGGRLSTQSVSLDAFQPPADDPTYRPLAVLPRTLSWTPFGSLAATADVTGMCATAYDSLGRPLEQRSASGTFRLDWDPSGRVAAIGYPGGRRLAFDRFAGGGLREIQEAVLGADYPGNPAAVAPRSIVRVERDGPRPASFTFGAGHRVALTAGAAGETVATDWRMPGGGPGWTERALRGPAGELRVHATNGASRVFGYDPMGRLVGVTDRAAGLDLDPATLAPNAEGAPTRDALDVALAAAEATLAEAPASAAWAWNLDANTNRLESSERIGSAPLRVTAYQPEIGDRYRTVGDRHFVHDRAGNLLDDGVHRFRYDTANRLVRIDGPCGPASFEYDAAGALAAIATPDGRRELGWLFGQLLEWRQDGRVEGQAVPLERPHQLAHVAAGGRDAWPIQDLTDTVTGWLDDAGVAVGDARYDPFGVLLERSGAWPAPFGFHGHLEIGATGIAHLLARSYHPALGRFLQPDPLGYADGPNPYAYARHAPGTLTDYWGFEAAGFDIGLVAWSATKSLGLGIGVGALAILAVATGVISAPTMAFAAVVGLSFGAITSILNRGFEAIAAGQEANGFLAIPLGLADMTGIPSIIEGGTHTNAMTGQALTTEQASEKLGGGVGTFGGLFAGGASGWAANKFAPRLPATQFSPSQAFWDDALKAADPQPEILAAEYVYPPHPPGPREEVVDNAGEAIWSRTGKMAVPAESGVLKGVDEAVLLGHGGRPQWTGKGGASVVYMGALGFKSPTQLADWLVNTANWEGGVLKLGHCNTGLYSKELGGIYGEQLAAELARLGKPTVVLAPEGVTSFNASGYVGIGVVGKYKGFIVGKEPNTWDPIYHFLPEGHGWAEFFPPTLYSR